MKRHVHCLGVMAAALLLLLVASRASAQTAVLDIDPSAISAGMGGASGAAFWTAEPNYWANPALLGYSQGVRWQWGRTMLAPGFGDIPFTAHRYTLGAYGIGLEGAGRPIGGLGRTFLDYRVYGSGSFEEMKGWGVGVSVARLVGSILALKGREAPAILDHVDLAAGMSSKSTTVASGPFDPSGQASARPTDHGVLIRGGFGSILPRGMGALPLRSDLALGASFMNDNGATFRFSTAPPESPSQNWRLSAAIREGLGLPRSLRDRARTPRATFFVDGLEPMVSLGLAYDYLTSRSSPGWWVNQFGAELTAFNVLSFRLGYWSEPRDDIDDLHWGFGLGLPIGDVAGVRVDYARYPQPLHQVYSDALPLAPYSFSVFVDPIALARRLRGGPGTD